MQVPRATRPTLVLLAVLILAAGCGPASPAGDTKPSATPTPRIAHAGQSADQILTGLKAKGLPVGASVTYTADNDPNKLLGRPGQYIGKVTFKDTRLADNGNQGVDISVGDGGSIEVFATLDAATKRTTYVQAISSSAALFTEYDFQDGLVLLRISHELTPDQENGYETALKTLP